MKKKEKIPLSKETKKKENDSIAEDIGLGFFLGEWFAD